MKKAIKTQSDIYPNIFTVNKLYENVYELEYCENVEQIEVQHENKVEKGYQYDMYLEQLTINTYEEFVASLVSLKYSIADEIALLKKLQTNVDKEEVDEYLKYVNSCKSFGKSYWEATYGNNAV